MQTAFQSHAIFHIRLVEEGDLQLAGLQQHRPGSADLPYLAEESDVRIAESRTTCRQGPEDHDKQRKEQECLEFLDHCVGKG